MIVEDHPLRIRAELLLSLKQSVLMAQQKSVLECAVASPNVEQALRALFTFDITFDVEMTRNIDIDDPYKMHKKHIYIKILHTNSPRRSHRKSLCISRCIARSGTWVV